jgi:tetratricopeptide (TPR) repeat protein
MVSIFPLLYSSILFFSLTSIAFYLVGQFKMSLKVESRLSSLEKKLQQNKTSSDYSYKLGQLYLGKKLYDKAISLFRNSLNYWDLNDKIGLGSLYNTLGFTYFKLKQYDHAVYYYTQAIKLLPDYTLALTNLGLVYESQQKYKDASTIYKSVLIYEPVNKIASIRLPIVQVKENLIA